MPNRELILATIDEFRKQHRSGCLGRTKLQKLCYFARELGVTYDLRYKMYFYGPYSEELEHEILELQVSDVVMDKSPDPGRYSNYELGARGTSEMCDGAEVTPWRPTIASVVTTLGGLRPEVLELLATVKFTFERQNTKKGVRGKVVNEVRELKGEKFSQVDVEEAYDALKAARVLGKKTPAKRKAC